MILKSIKLNNIRSYSDEEIIFPEGSILLSGDIGAGKSTILMAVEFALFGIMKAEFSGSSLLRNGKNYGSVELNFLLDGKDITIKRALKRQGGSVKQEAGSIIIDGVETELMPQELRSKVISLIGYPEDFLTSAKSLIFRYTVYTPQEEMKKIIFDDPSERLNSLRKIFGIDKYKTIVSNAEIVARKLGEEKRVLAERIVDLDEKIKQKNELEYELKIIKETLHQISLELKKSHEILTEKKREAELKEQRFSEYNKIKNKLEVLDTIFSEKETHRKKLELELSSLNKEIEALGKKAEEIEILVSLEGLEAGIEEDEKVYLQKLSEIASLKSKEANMCEKIKSEEEELHSFEEKINEISAKEARLLELKNKVLGKADEEEKLKTLKELVAKLREEIAVKEAWKKTAADLKESISYMERCPVCYQPIFAGQKEDIKDAQEKKLREIDDELKKISSKIEHAEEELKACEERLKLIAKAEKEANIVEGELSTSKFVKENYLLRENKLAELKKELEMLSSEVRKTHDVEKLNEQIKRKKEVLKKAKEIDFAKKSLAEKIEKRKTIENEISKLKNELSALQESKAKLHALFSDYQNCESEMINARKDVEKAQEMLKNVEMKKVAFEKDVENKEGIIKQLDAEIARKTEAKNYMQKISERQSWLKEKFASFVKLVESHVMQSIHEEFESHFKQWVSVLLEDSSINARLGEDFTPKVEQNGYEMDIAYLSGGEKTSFALAYRLALNKVINDVLSAIKTKDLLILDEPTDGFSTEQLDKVREVIDQLDISQIIIVSHEPKLESFVQNIIRIDKSHDVSRVLA